MAHAGVNPYHAEDLLKQAVAQNSARHELRDGNNNNMHDQIDYSSPTPSGVETPRPDFHDKRSPGIMPGYFDAARRASASSIGSLVMVERATAPTPPPEEQTGAKTTAVEDRSRLPPTPISSAASVIHRDGDSAETGLLESGIQSIAQALRNFVLPKSNLSGKPRRPQSLPVASVTRSNVAAAHISNPASSSPSSPPPSSPATSRPSRAPPPQLQSSEENGLTLDAAPGSRAKATPPHTPRALSQEDRPQSPLASDAVSEADKQNKPAVATLPSASTRGKLAVRIAEGRNLKPAFDPYVVCVFEYNEYISKGPKHDAMEVDGQEQEQPDPRNHSIPIRRTDSDMGKPMAIPTRSRQSSTNGMGDVPPRLQRVTDPQWDHEAVFDVTGRHSELDVSVYDRHQDTFLGHVRLCLNLTDKQPLLEGFFALGPRGPQDKDITAFGKVRFPRDALSTEGRNFVKGLLNRNPKHRLGATRDAVELMEHPFFADVDWEALAKKNLVPPFKPKLSSQADTSNFDPEFTNALNTSSSLNARAAALAGNAAPASTPLSPTMQNAFRGFTFVDESAFEQHLGPRGDELDDRVDESASLSRSHNRMSGLQRTGTHDDAFFQAGEWEQ
ncbi:hypothetical protein DV738_g4091, partial [Chaetothyriales sp. CBS 135597]